MKKVGNRSGRQTNIKIKGRPAICGKCGRNMNQLRPKTKKVGDLEYTYIKCRRCGAVFVSAVTDSALRAQVESYAQLQAGIAVTQKELTKLRADKARKKELIEAKETIVETMIRNARKLLDMNVKRCRELRERYPLDTNGMKL